MPSQYDQEWIDQLLREGKPRPVVYFVGWEDGPIKVGHALDLQHRLHQIQVHCPFELKVWAVREGSRNIEREYHKRFQHLWIRGEWFERSYDIVQEIERLRSWNAKGWNVPNHCRGKAAPLTYA